MAQEQQPKNLREYLFSFVGFKQSQLAQLIGLKRQALNQRIARDTSGNAFLEKHELIQLLRDHWQRRSDPAEALNIINSFTEHHIGQEEIGGIKEACGYIVLSKAPYEVTISKYFDRVVVSHLDEGAYFLYIVGSPATAERLATIYRRHQLWSENKVIRVIIAVNSHIRVLPHLAIVHRVSGWKCLVCERHNDDIIDAHIDPDESSATVFNELDPGYASELLTELSSDTLDCYDVQSSLEYAQSIIAQDNKQLEKSLCEGTWIYWASRLPVKITHRVQR